MQFLYRVQTKGTEVRIILLFLFGGICTVIGGVVTIIGFFVSLPAWATVIGSVSSMVGLVVFILQGIRMV